MHDQDSTNAIVVSGILDRYGWLSSAKIGERAHDALFLVVQHADLATQVKYLPLLRQAVSQKRASPADLALLEDRVALRQGRRQVYGSQIGFDPITNTSFVSPLHDPDHVDERRKSVGLPPFASYLAHFGLTWDVEAYKKDLPRIEKMIKDRGY